MQVRESAFSIAMSEIIKVRFGTYTFAFLLNNEGLLQFLETHFDDFLVDTHPDVKIIMHVIPAIKSSIITPGNHYTYSIYNEQFNFGPNLIQGYWDVRNRVCDIDICDFILTQEEVWLFDRFLCRMFYTLALQRENKQLKTIIVHCAGIERNGKGYIFIGGPGSGKSTIANFSRKYNVLHDDMNLVFINEKELTVEGVPFNPKLIERTKSSGTLSMICSLHQADVDRIEKGSFEEFIQKILPEVFLPIPLLSEDKKQAFIYLLSSVRQLGSVVPYYKLFFKKNDKFWEIIETEEDNNG
jgi:hypothetical protein